MSQGSVVVAVLSHRDPPLLHRLISRVLEGERTVVVVHHDPRGEPHGIRESDRVRLVPDPRPCEWGRMSQALGMYRTVAAALELVDDMEWALLVSGMDYPAQHLRRTEAFLDGCQADVLMRHFDVPDEPSPDEDPWQTLCRRRYLQRIRLPGSRRSIPFPRRPPFDEDLRLYIGDTWVNLARPAVEHLVDQYHRHPELRRYLDRCGSPDEALTPTLVLNHDGRLRVRNDRRRYIRWTPETPHPQLLDHTMTAEITASGDFFARKVDSVASQQLMDELDAIAASQVST